MFGADMGTLRVFVDSPQGEKQIFTRSGINLNMFIVILLSIKYDNIFIDLEAFLCVFCSQIPIFQHLGKENINLFIFFCLFLRNDMLLI